MAKTKTTQKEKRAKIIERIDKLEEAIYLAENAEEEISALIKDLKKLKPTKKELENGLQDTFDEYENY